jgi:hypothetical protein
VGKRRRLPPIFWVLVALLALLLLVGVGSIGYYIFLTVDTGKTEEVTDIWSDLDATAISPGLAIWALTDIEPEQIYRQAMANDELASATAMALTTANLPNTQRLGWLTVLARRHASAGDKATARHLLDLAADIAILEPTLADYRRAETMLDVAREWSAMGESEKARKQLDQATLITQRSDTLSPPIRQQILIFTITRSRLLAGKLNAGSRSVLKLSVVISRTNREKIPCASMPSIRGTL